MRLPTDGVTPIPRLVMVDDFGEDDGYFCELTDPLFLAPGDRVRFDGMRMDLVVTRADGGILSPAGTWGVRCGRDRSRR
ncbi:hypothetical protein ACFY00_21970 [Kitasatospora sp. NPDC001540]|uniref:hypothetical protein n=1 Tax=Kitasatospora sp. NPDC001540 TaxID=3364014 RepID=UPI003691AFBD